MDQFHNQEFQLDGKNSNSFYEIKANIGMCSNEYNVGEKVTSFTTTGEYPSNESRSACQLD